MTSPELPAQPVHEIHTCRDCGAVITLPYIKPGTKYHEPGEPHTYHLGCVICGVSGQVRVSIVPEVSNGIE